MRRRRVLGALGSLGTLGGLAACGVSPVPDHRRSAAPVVGPRRLALVIGNANYRGLPKLRNTLHDAQLVADAARAAGFALHGGGVLRDADHIGMAASVSQFAQAGEAADAVLLYYAGHGAQLEGQNWLAPVDAAAFSRGNFYASMVRVGGMLDAVSRGRSGVGLVLLDACRDNPFLAPNAASLERGLGKLHPPAHVAVGFATQPGEQAMDGFAVDGPYAVAIARVLRRGVGRHLAVDAMLAEINDDVWRVSGARQRPWYELGDGVRGQLLSGAAATRIAAAG